MTYLNQSCIDKFTFVDQQTQLKYQVNSKNKTMTLVSDRCSNKIELIAGENLCPSSEVRLGWNDYSQLFSVFQKTKCIHFSEATNGTVTDSAFGLDIKTDCCGNIYVVGYFHGTLSLGHLPPLTSIGLHDLFIAKPNPALGWISANSAGGDRTSVDNISLTIDCSNNVYVTGSYFDGPLQFRSLPALPSTGTGNIFVVKLNSAFVHTNADYAGQSVSVGYGIVVDHCNNVYVAGQCAGDAMFGMILFTCFNINSINNGFGNANGVVLKLDSNLNWIRAAIIGLGNYTSGLTNITLTNDYSGNIYVAVVANGSIAFGSINLDPFGSTANLYIAKADSSLNWIEAINTGASGTASFVFFRIAITADDSGNIYITSGFDGTIPFGQTVFEC